MQKLEYPYKPTSSYSISKADAIVVLSGVLKKIEIKNNTKYEFAEGNRFLSSIDLINQNHEKIANFIGTVHFTNKVWS